VEENVTPASVEVVVPEGPDIVVSWTVQLQVAGLGSVLPTESVARTANVWVPDENA
jgi:hypothetical protein